MMFNVTVSRIGPERKHAKRNGGPFRTRPVKHYGIAANG
jgi:hypothetical protein